MATKQRDTSPEAEARREKHRAARLRGAQNALEAVKMRLGGATYQAIGDALDVSRVRATQYVKKALDDLVSEIREHADRHRALELRRIDSLIEICMDDLYETTITKRKNDRGMDIEEIKRSHVVKPKIMALILKAIDLRIELLGIRRQREAPEDGAPRTSIEEALREIDEEEVPAADFTVMQQPGIEGPTNGAQEERKEDGESE